MKRGDGVRQWVLYLAGAAHAAAVWAPATAHGGPTAGTSVTEELGWFGLFGPEPKMKVVSYNMRSHDTVNGFSWEQRHINFASYVAQRHAPAIIAMQEVYEWSDCFSSWCQNCERMAWGEYLDHFLTKLHQHTGRPYRIATNVRNGPDARVCFSLEKEGEAIVYDESQVNLVPLAPSTNVVGCQEKRTNLETWYGHGNAYSDCVPTRNYRYSYAAQAVFEFPPGTNRYFSVYNTHKDDCDILRSIAHIEHKQSRLRRRLEAYLADHGNTEPVSLYPPIYAGDMNSHRYPACDNFEEIESSLRTHFIDAPHDAYEPPQGLLDSYGTCNEYLCSSRFETELTQTMGVIDKVWVGRYFSYFWGRDFRFSTVTTPVGDCWPLGKRAWGRDVWQGCVAAGDRLWFSDHSPTMVEVSANPLHLTGHADCSQTVEQCCEPQCAGKNCGPDGCGGTCGSCRPGWFCDGGWCEPPY